MVVSACEILGNVENIIIFWITFMIAGWKEGRKEGKLGKENSSK